jgi:3-deoxy-D-manno-octulosonic-acid transferase
MFSSSTKELFQKFDICFSSSIQSKKYLQSLGAKTIKYIGNLKFSQTEKNEDFLNKNLKKYFLSKKIWCAASTHNTEEKFCLIAHKKLKKRHKNLLTIIIPRHIDRTKSIIEEVKNLNLKVHTHDSKKKISNDTDVYLVNSYGKTKSFFKICKTVFLGGSLIKHGGQNPLEAARYGCKILHGPNVSNFQEIYSLLNKYNVSNQITNLNGITNNVDKLFNNKTNSSNIKNKIKGLGDKILNSTLKEVNFFIKKNETKKT